MTLRIVFDFGGVLFRWQPAQLLLRTLPQRLADETAARRLAASFFQGYGGDWAAFDRGEIEVPALARNIAARTGLALDEVLRVIEGVKDELQPLPDSVALLQRLHAQGRRLHYLSNMPAPYADHLDARHGFLRCFESGVFSSRERLAKPEPAIFEHAARRFGAVPGDLLFLDDYPANVEAALRCGWQALLFENAAQAEAALAQRGLLG
jgi:putative hydrolase of the HAD superfamily